jgi:osmotically-inducible protein OsmY
MTSDTAPARRTTPERQPTDQEMQRAVVDELEWTPGVEVARIGVAVRDGVVTLTGDPGTTAAAVAARESAARVRGVIAVADELQVGALVDPPRIAPGAP